MEKVMQLTNEQFETFKLEMSKKRVKFIKKLLGINRKNKMKLFKSKFGVHGEPFEPKPLEVYSCSHSGNHLGYCIIIQPNKMHGTHKLCECYRVDVKISI